MQGLVYNRLLAIKEHIRQYERDFNRLPHSVFLLAVSKGQSIAAIKEAIAAGQNAFAENYWQEASEKITALADFSLEWHFIGKIQSNKIKYIAEHFHWVHSVNSFSVAKKLSDCRPAHLLPLNICLQVNISEEPSKGGALISEIKKLAEQCLSLSRIKLRGLMALPARKDTFAGQRAELLKLRKLFDELNQKQVFLDTLSMGTSQDLRAAIAAGATLVRVGRAIFTD